MRLASYVAKGKQKSPHFGCCLKNSRFRIQNSRIFTRLASHVAKGKQKSPNFAMLSQKFAILDSKFAMIARLASHVAKRKQKSPNFAMLSQKFTINTSGLRIFLYNNVNRLFQRYCFQSSFICTEPLKPSVQLKRAQIIAIFAPKNHKNAQIRVEFPKIQNWPVEIAMKTRNIANSVKQMNIIRNEKGVRHLFSRSTAREKKCNLKKKKYYEKLQSPREDRTTVSLSIVL